MVSAIQQQDEDNQMKFFAMKHCQDCGQKRSLIERLFAIDDERCDLCHFRFVRSVRERR